MSEHPFPSLQEAYQKALYSGVPDKLQDLALDMAVLLERAGDVLETGRAITPKSAVGADIQKLLARLGHTQEGL